MTMPDLRHLFKRSRSDEGVPSHSAPDCQSDTASLELRATEPTKAHRQRAKLQRRSRSEDAMAQMLQNAKSGDTGDSHAYATAMTLSPKPKDERQACLDASEMLIEQVDNQIAGQRTSSQANTVASSKSSWTAAKRLLGEQTGNSLSRTRSQAKAVAATKSFSPPDKKDRGVSRSGPGPTDQPVTFRLVHRPKVSQEQEKSSSSYQPLPDITKIKTPVTAYLPPDQACAVVAAQQPPMGSPGPETTSFSTPRESSSPSPTSSPATSIASTPSPGSTKGKAKARNGPATCTYDGSTKTSLGAPYVPWVRWRCCKCRHETHWESQVCSKLDCSHAKCENCEKMAK